MELGLRWSGARSSIFDCLDALQHTLLHSLRQRRVIERRRHAFTLGESPVEKLDQLFAFSRVLLLFVNQQPRRPRYWINLFAGWVDHGKSEVLRNLRRRECFGNRFKRRSDELARGVFYVRKCQFILASVSEFNIR